MEWAKLIRIVRATDGKVRAYIGEQPLLFIDYQEDYGRHGHIIMLTVPAEQIQFEHESA